MALKQEWIRHRHYTVPPEKKLVEQCASHGADHAAYGWHPQYDPRWSEEQKNAYLNAYEEGLKKRKANEV